VHVTLYGVGHTDSVVSVKFSNSGKYVATASYDGTVGLWKSDTGEHVRNLEGSGEGVEVRITLRRCVYSHAHIIY